MAFFWRRKKEDAFSSSVLGLDKSIEELKAQEDAVELEFGVRFSRAIEKTRHSINDRLDSIFEGRKQIDEAVLDELEEMLISTDIGVATTMQILEAVRQGVSRAEINDAVALKAAMKKELLSILHHAEEAGVADERSVDESIRPYVIMIVGVNGVGKTTTIGKLAQRIKDEGNDVLICAADTFRAAASDQLEIWAGRAGVQIVQQKEGTDPAAVLFDSLKAAKARNADVLIIDTAGRLHNKANLMAELEKMKRVAAREVEAAPHETLLVIDAVTGQNGLEQARQFMKTADVTGIVLTKLDGTAKGGIAVAIAKELNLPIRYVGIGEQVNDLMVFEPELYVNSLFEQVIPRLANDANTEIDLAMARRALDLALKGVGLVSPNPLVGCVIVSAGGDVVGEGTYIFDNVIHAEAIALAQAGDRARGGTAYVSLEPHSHHGKTPPCTEALIDAGIKRVVAPIEDPNPLVSGRGFQSLREAGIDVVTGILADEAAQLNERFICWHRNKRPFVNLKLAMSLDGRISLNNSVSTALSSEEARHRVQELRHENDAILVGGNTAVVDDPNLTDRSGRPRRRPLVRVVLDNRLRLSEGSTLVRTAPDIPTIVFTSAHDANETRPLKERGVDVVELGSGGRDLDAVLQYLAEQEIQSVLVEGGTQIAGAFCDSRLVDKVTFIYTPLIIGGDHAPVAVGGKGAGALSDALQLRNVTTKSLGRDIEITGYPTES